MFHRVPLVKCAEIDVMDMDQRLSVPGESGFDLEERVHFIVELWGEGEALEEKKIVDVAVNLYGFSPDEVREALFENLRKGTIGARFYIPNP